MTILVLHAVRVVKKKNHVCKRVRAHGVHVLCACACACVFTLCAPVRVRVRVRAHLRICAEFWQHWEGGDETTRGGPRDGMPREGSAAAEEIVLLKGRSMEDLRPRQLYMYGHTHNIYMYSHTHMACTRAYCVYVCVRAHTHTHTHTHTHHTQDGRTL
jgi:hypothetical protein